MVDSFGRYRIPVRRTDGTIVYGEVAIATPKDVEVFRQQLQQSPVLRREVRGICSTCQTEQSVSRNPNPDANYREMGDEDLYLIDPHEAYGQRCEGWGTTPQALVKG